MFNRQSVPLGSAIENRKLKAFTLIELLVVIAIISLLVSILLPSLNKAKALARTVVCASNLSNLGLSSLLYTEDHNGNLMSEPWESGDPLSDIWIYRICPYIGQESGRRAIDDGNGSPFEPLQCPEMAGQFGLNENWWQSSYALNWMIGSYVIESWPGWPRLWEIDNPSEVAYFADFCNTSRICLAYHVAAYPDGYSEEVVAKTFVHNDNALASVLYVDGHVGTLNEDQWNSPSAATKSPPNIELPWDPWGPGQFGNP